MRWRYVMLEAVIVSGGGNLNLQTNTFQVLYFCLADFVLFCV